MSTSFFSFSKNLARTSLFAFTLALLFSVNTYANAPLGVSSLIKVVNETDTKAIALHIPETNAPRVLIKLKNAKNEVLFQKRVKVKDGFAQKFSLENLEDGQYQLTITDEEKVVKQGFQITDNKVLMSKSDKTSFTHPNIQFLDSRKLMQVAAFTENPIEINVYDMNGDVIISEKGVQLSKAYNLSKLLRGEYTVEVFCEGEVYYKTLDL